MRVKNTSNAVHCIAFIAIFIGVLNHHVNGYGKPHSDFLLGIDGSSIATAQEHICVLEQKNVVTEDEIPTGRAQCWGYDGFGRLESPKDIDFVQIVAGKSFTCGIDIDQRVTCWGLLAAEVPGLYEQITAAKNGHFACGIMTNQRLNCWGQSQMVNHFPKDPTIQFKQVSCSKHHCCALDSKAYPHCWGSGTLGETRPPTITFAEFVRAKSSLGDSVIEVLASESEEDIYLDSPLDDQLAALEEQQVEDFEISSGSGSGGGARGKTSGGSSSSAAADAAGDVLISRLQLRQISVGDGQSCGITLLGSHLICWGKRDPRKQKSQSEPPLYAPGPYKQVSVGSKGVCAIVGEIDNAVSHSATAAAIGAAVGAGAGKAGAGQKGSGRAGAGAIALDEVEDGEVAPAERPEDMLECWGPAQRIVRTTPNEAWDQVAVGFTHVCAVSMDSQLHCWGHGLPKEVQNMHTKFIVA